MTAGHIEVSLIILNENRQSYRTKRAMLPAVVMKKGPFNSNGPVKFETKGGGPKRLSNAAA